MPITGSDRALMQCRSGIERAGATRTGYYYSRPVLTINSVDRTSAVAWNTLRVDLHLNDQPDEAFFELKENAGFVPTVGQTVVVGNGTAANREFAGQIISIRHRRMAGLPNHDRLFVRCKDWTQLLDRQRITTRYTSVSATYIARDIIATYTSGFTSLRVETDLAVVDEFVLINEAPSTALRKLANTIGGYFYVDASQDVHFWVTSDPFQSAPQTLSETQSSLKWFDLERDYSQIRTQIIVEGVKRPVMIDVPAGETSIPIQVGWGIPTNGTPNPPLTPYVRIGTQILLYGSVTNIVGPPASLVTADAVVTDTSVTLASTTGFSSSGWAHDAGGNLFKYSSKTATQLTGIPASGYGSIQTDIKTDTPVYEQDHLLLATTLPEAITTGDLVTYRLIVDDSTAQAAIAAIESGDGIHQHVIQDESWGGGGLVSTGDSASLAGLAELDAFNAALRRASWVTQDLVPKPGRTQVFNFTSPAYSDTLTITKVTVTWPDPNIRPFRACEASTIKVEDVTQIIRRRWGV